MTEAHDPKSAPRRSNRWVKGQSGNPARKWKKGNTPGGIHGTTALQRKFEGRAGDRAVRKLFRRKSIPVVHALSRIIADSNVPASVRVAAAQLFLERGWGKIEADSGPKKRAKKKDGPIVVVRHTPRSPYNSGGV